MEMTTAVPVSFTAGALDEIRRLMSAPEFDTTQFLRVGVKGGGCSGLSYVLGFDDKQADDAEFEFEGQFFIMNKSHAIYLNSFRGAEVAGLEQLKPWLTNANFSVACRNYTTASHTELHRNLTVIL